MDYLPAITSLAEALKWPITALIALIAVFALRGVLEHLVEVLDGALRRACIRYGDTKIDLRDLRHVPSRGDDELRDPSAGD